ncbi:hypothetical protein AZ014_004303, partial [Klebsiella pneumoniae]
RSFANICRRMRPCFVLAVTRRGS